MEVFFVVVARDHAARLGSARADKAVRAPFHVVFFMRQIDRAAAAGDFGYFL